MNAGRDVERLIAGWLVEEAVPRAPDRILDGARRVIDRTTQRHASRAPWRPTSMNRYALLGAAAAIATVLVGGGLLLRPGNPSVGGPSASPLTASPSAPAGSPSPGSASPTPGPSLGIIGLLDTSWVSHRYGYSVGYPAAWTATPANADWKQGKRTLWGDPALDTLTGTDVRFVAASQPIAAGKSADDWFTDYCVINGGAAADCGSATSHWTPIQIGSGSGWIDTDGEPSPPNGIAPGGIVFDAVAVSGNRGYEFTLDGNVDRTSFDRLMAGVDLTPADADKVAHLTASFRSGIYGYGLLRDPAWTTKKATMLVDDPRSSDGTALDVVTVTGTDTSINGSASALHGRTYAQWAASRHQDVLQDNPVGCDGGDPSTWPIVDVGGHQGHLDQWCNAAEVSVPVGDRVYIFDWSNKTFSGASHLGEAQFLRVLEGVTLSG